MIFFQFRFHAAWGSILLFHLMLVIAAISCKIEQEGQLEKIQHYGTGEISRRYLEVSGKKEGVMTDYYPDGKLKGERLFKNDIQVGKTTLYFPNGKIKEVQYYLNGLKEGGDTTFYENGLPAFVVAFHEGKKDGYLRKWSPEGALIFEAKYSMETLVEVKGQNVRPDTFPPADSVIQQ